MALTDAERKAIGHIVRSGADLFAATMGNKPIWDNRRHMREVIGQHVDAEIALLGNPGYLAEYIVAVNQASDSPEKTT